MQMAIGQKLEEARNRKGISLREASESTKIRGDYLSAFEAGQFDIDLPEVYLRGFVRLYSRFLGLDQEAVLADLSMEMGSSSRSAKKSLGSLSVPDNPEGTEYANAPPSAGKTSADSAAYHDLLKPLLIVGAAILLLSLVIIIIIASTKDSPEGPNQETPPATSTVTETNPNPTAPSTVSPQAASDHSLRIAVIAPVERLIVMNEGGPFPGTNERIREFKDLPSGWEGTLTFTDSFKCYCSSLENLRFFVDDGAEKQIEGEGSGNFTWKPE